jgi:D-alanyl-D-alanine carboxypeptidase
MWHVMRTAAVALLPLVLLASACSGGPATPVAALPSTGANPPTAAPAPSSPAPPPPVRWHVTVRYLPLAIRDGMIATGTWHQGCPVPLHDLRLVTVSYWGFDGVGHVGRLVTNRDAAGPIATALHELWSARFPIRRMIPIQAFGASDDRSMAKDNTAVFNCRDVRGASVWSQHAYGRAIDINPRENPEVKGSLVLPRNAHAFVDRSRRRKGMIFPGDVVVRVFTAVGWGWGGYWRSLKDWQHFSANGR